MIPTLEGKLYYNLITVLQFFSWNCSITILLQLQVNSHFTEKLFCPRFVPIGNNRLFVDFAASVSNRRVSQRRIYIFTVYLLRAAWVSCLLNRAARSTAGSRLYDTNSTSDARMHHFTGVA